MAPKYTTYTIILEWQKTSQKMMKAITSNKRVLKKLISWKQLNMTAKGTFLNISNPFCIKATSKAISWLSIKVLVRQVTSPVLFLEPLLLSVKHYTKNLDKLQNSISIVISIKIYQIVTMSVLPKRKHGHKDKQPIKLKKKTQEVYIEAAIAKLMKDKYNKGNFIKDTQMVARKMKESKELEEKLAAMDLEAETIRLDSQQQQEWLGKYARSAFLAQAGSINAKHEMSIFNGSIVNQTYMDLKT
ncbi:hypothetical protein L228DRAFT_240826 [Xylona heveae TC161]|uniref:Uncharacterized protein n=1 Tax=Xylona heveae (strain CBS 132557 / TC161) TaxID=1328760 RepID=A0A165AD92_XYLHT|nr:hypothetical protein L228DRAFT_240826 [Xylona heveae TC161]KZF20286.1 hypothetical protein L228DRAFT_240826 [Xylona heveae TC161]